MDSPERKTSTAAAPPCRFHGYWELMASSKQWGMTVLLPRCYACSLHNAHQEHPLPSMVLT